MQDRSSPRHSVTIIGNYRSGSGLKRQVTMTDLSETGCRFYDRRSVLQIGSTLTLRIQTLGPFDAIVKWMSEDRVGVQFANPIYGPVFEHIKNTLDNSDWRPPA
ncbi:PilZ domain-containing protein [Pontixanthobacter gangjinensis]|uniref:PilZ domain-containing protein n=1 Tax=Pontixanthobacter gangjinensis TaxID=1028742 RepID=A0A6I4SKV2_9SPHN|nr:PilZ domain-containing protein [Pontixanthobacter gangjinensis]MXO55760.1 hypothetical protein [Pontixanthobacter gangjinensis]